MNDRKAAKAPKAGMMNAKAKPEVQQLDFLQRAAYPAELQDATTDVVRVGEATWVRITRIANPPDPAMNRYSASEWKAQLHSFKTLGIKSAVHVRTVETGFWLEDGRHRVLGATELGWAYVKADIDHAGNAGSSAVWRWEANTKRKADRPLDQAVAWQEMMDPQGANLSQKQVAEVTGISASTISRRLRLLLLPRELAQRVGVDVEEQWLEPLYCVAKDAELLKAGAEAVLRHLKNGRIQDAQNVLDVAEEAWIEAGLAIREDDEAFSYEVREDAAFTKAEKSFKPFTVKVPSRYGDGLEEVVFYREAKAAVAKAQEISDRLAAERAAEEAKLAAKAAKQGKAVQKQPDGSVRIVDAPKKRTLAERVPEQRTKVQLDLMARFVPAQVAFPDDLVGEALARFVAHTNSLTAEQDMAAACRALGLKMPEKKPGSLRSVRLRREDVLELWAKDKPAAMRYVAVALFFQARDFHKQLEHGVEDHGMRYGKPAVKEPRLPVWLTGKTFEDATELAKQAIRDRDAGFRTVLDGAPCDHCDEPATLRKGNVNVCRSDVYGKVDVKSLAARRLQRQAAKQPAAVPVEAGAEA